MGLGLREAIVVLFTGLLVLAIIWPYGRILSRAGYSPWLCILAIVPVVNIVAMWAFAYAKWPAVERPPAV
jgi:hypothetical protein